MAFDSQEFGGLARFLAKLLTCNFGPRLEGWEMPHYPFSPEN